MRGEPRPVAHAGTEVGDAGARADMLHTEQADAQHYQMQPEALSDDDEMEMQRTCLFSPAACLPPAATVVSPPRCPDRGPWCAMQRRGSSAL